MMKQLRRLSRRRLIPALVVMAALAVLAAVGIGQALHGWAETSDSLAYWRDQLEAEESGDAPSAGGFDSPAGRVRRLEAELGAVPGRLFPLVAMFVFAAGLLVLGVRALRREPL